MLKLLIISDKLSFLALIVSIIGIIIPIVRSKIKEYHAIKKRKDDLLCECMRGLGVDDTNLFQTDLFIPIHAQMNDRPHDCAEKVVSSDGRYDLVEKLLEGIFPKQAINQYKSLRYIIIGGSGMGKSTFAAYFCYYLLKKKFSKDIPLSIYAYNLNAHNLNDIRTLITKKISKPQKSILILDSIDESIEAIEDYNSFWKEINEMTNDFRVVILTCRTQFFDFGSHSNTTVDNAIKEPIDSCVKQASNTPLNWQHHYISPFTETEIDNYLIAKYKFDSERYKRASNILEKTDDLMSRPFLLTYIDDLLGIDWVKNDITSAQIYNEIIIKWFQREIDHNPKKGQFDINTLYAFAKSIAYYIYSQGRLVISYEEFCGFCEQYGISNKLDLDKNKKDTLHKRSLLNRNEEGYIKFSHKSILEFFIAVHSLENPEIQYNSKGYNMAMLFSKELYSLYLKDSSVFFVKFKNIRIATSASFFSLTMESKMTTLLKEWEEVNNMSSETRKNANLSLLYELWECLLNSIVDKESVSCARKIGNRAEVLHQLCESVKNFNRRTQLRSLQDVLIQNDVNSKINKEMFFLWRQKLEFVDSIINKASASEAAWGAYSDSYINNNPIVFPTYGFKYINDEDVITIGNGFVSSEEIMLEKIKSIYESLSDGACMCILKDIADIKDQADYINRIIEYITFVDSKNVIISFCGEEIRYDFLIDKNSIKYSNEQFATFLQNLRSGALAYCTHNEIKK